MVLLKRRQRLRAMQVPNCQQEVLQVFGQGAYAWHEQQNLQPTSSVSLHNHDDLLNDALAQEPG